MVMISAANIDDHARPRDFLRPLPAASLEIVRSQLDSTGFCEVPSALAPLSLSDLQSEAVAQFDGALHSRSDRGLSYEAYIADLGSVGAAYVRSPSMLALLQLVFGRGYALDASKSCYTYYLEGCFLAPHRDDIPGPKAVSVLTYLWAESGPRDGATGPRLDIFSRAQDARGPLTASIATREGSLVMGYGTEFWHGRPQLGPSEKVIVMNGSYSAL